MAEDVKTFEIEDKVVENNEDSSLTTENLEGLTDGEKEMAKKHLEISEEPKEEEKQEEGVQDNTETVKEGEEEETKPEPTVEEPSEEEPKEDASDKEKALYREMKKDRDKRQQAQAERDLLKIQIQALEEKVKLNAQGLNTDNPLDKELVGVDKQIKAIEEGDGDEYSDTISRADLKELRKLENRRQEILLEKDKERHIDKDQEARKQQSRLLSLEHQGRERDPENFDYMFDKAKEMLIKERQSLGDSNTIGFYQAQVINSANQENQVLNPDVEFGMGSTFIDTVYKIAKQHPEFSSDKNKRSEEPKKEEEQKESNAARILKNAEKGKSSASLGGSGKRIVTEDDLTLEDALKLSTSEYRALKQETKERLLGK